MLRVLSIDGGGIRGAIPATILQELERISGKRVFELFDLIVGTSTGGIIALALTCPGIKGIPSPASTIRQLYVDHGSELFPLGGQPLVRSSWSNLLLGTRTPIEANATTVDRFKHFMGFENIAKTSAPLGGNSGGQGNARYPAGPLERRLQETFGQTPMNAAVRGVAVVTCDFDTGEPIVIAGGGVGEEEQMGEILMRDAARATSAAPTYFQPKTIFGRRLVDGGLVANDPALLGFSTAASILRVEGRPLSDMLLVSLGTGEPYNMKGVDEGPIQQLVDSRSWLNLAGPLAGAFRSSPGAFIRDQIMIALGTQYHRYQVVLPSTVNPALDDARPENIAALVQTADAYLQSNSREFNELARTLCG